MKVTVQSLLFSLSCLSAQGDLPGQPLSQENMGEILKTCNLTTQIQAGYTPLNWNLSNSQRTWDLTACVQVRFWRETHICMFHHFGHFSLLLSPWWNQGTVAGPCWVWPRSLQKTCSAMVIPCVPSGVARVCASVASSRQRFWRWWFCHRIHRSAKLCGRFDGRFSYITRHFHILHILVLSRIWKGDVLY